MCHIGLEDKDRLVNSDIRSLLSRVPVDEALEVFLTELKKDNDLEDRAMLTLSTRSNCNLTRTLM